MAESVLTPGCKVNLSLRLGPPREDGYHDLRTLFYPLENPHDTLTIRVAGAAGGLHFACKPALTAPGTNLVERAYVAYAAAGGHAPDIEVTLTKNAPVGGGLGGGSADAAAMLRWLEDYAQRLDRSVLGEERLAAVALSLGADVPFFLLGKPAWASGVGERLTPAAVDLDGLWLLLASPGIHVATGWAYAAWDALLAVNPLLKKNAEEVLTSEDDAHKYTVFPGGMPLVNDFESVVYPQHPELRRLKEALLAHGARVALLSGSGASLFGLFRTREQAETAAEALMRRPPAGLARLAFPALEPLKSAGASPSR